MYISTTFTYINNKNTVNICIFGERCRMYYNSTMKQYFVPNHLLSEVVINYNNINALTG